MKRVAAASVFVVTLVVLGWRFLVPTDDREMASHRSGSAAVGSSPAGTSAVGTTSPHRVVQLTPEQRAQTASRIKAAHGAHPTTPPPRLPDGSSGRGASDDAMATPQQVLEQLQSVSDEVRGYIAECRRYAPDLTSFSTSLELIGDPDVGTLIDAPRAAHGSNGQPVPAAFDDCVRSQLQTLELPPIKTGDKFTVMSHFTL